MHRPSVAGPLRAVLFQHKAVGTVVYQAYGLAARQLLFDAAVAPVILVAVGMPCQGGRVGVCEQNGARKQIGKELLENLKQHV